MRLGINSPWHAFTKREIIYEVFKIGLSTEMVTARYYCLLYSEGSNRVSAMHEL